MKYDKCMKIIGIFATDLELEYLFLPPFFMTLKDLKTLKRNKKYAFAQHSQRLGGINTSSKSHSFEGTHELRVMGQGTRVLQPPRS